MLYRRRCTLRKLFFLNKCLVESINIQVLCLNLLCSCAILLIFKAVKDQYNIQYFSYHYHHYNEHHISKFWQVRNLRLPFHFSVAVLQTLLWISGHCLSATSLFIWITSGIGAASFDSWFHEYEVNWRACFTTITFVNVSITILFVQNYFTFHNLHRSPFVVKPMTYERDVQPVISVLAILGNEKYHRRGKKKILLFHILNKLVQDTQTYVCMYIFVCAWVWKGSQCCQLKPSVVYITL